MIYSYLLRAKQRIINKRLQICLVFSLWGKKLKTIIIYTVVLLKNTSYQCYRQGALLQKNVCVCVFLLMNSLVNTTHLYHGRRGPKKRSRHFSFLSCLFQYIFLVNSTIVFIIVIICLRKKIKVSGRQKAR